MKVLITGVCGFVGSRVALHLREHISDLRVVGIDNLLRPGSEANRQELAGSGVQFFHGDMRMRSDVDNLPDCDWVVDAAANPSVLAGIDGRSSSRQLSEHNLFGTVNLLEYCRERKAGLVLLSTSRVYSVRALASLPVVENGTAFALDEAASSTPGVTASGLTENFSVEQPISLYGATKLASEIMALEYSGAFQFPVWIDRCGVLAGAGQFGTAEQGIFSYWLHAYAARLPLRYIGFGGRGLQVRDGFHPHDLAALIAAQFQRTPPQNAVYNVGGGAGNAMSVAELTSFAGALFGEHTPKPDLRPRPFDIPWLIMDFSRARDEFGWEPQRSLTSILNEIADHVRAHPRWLALSGAL